MAEEEEKVAPETEKKKKGKLGLLVVAFVLLVLLAGGGFAVWTFVFKGGGAQETGAARTQGPAAGVEGMRVTREPGPLFELGSFIVNLQEREGDRYLKAVMQLEMDNEKLRKELERRLPQLRDTIISLLSAKTLEEVSSYTGKEMLKSEIKGRINRLLATGQIRQVYFTEFVVQ